MADAPAYQPRWTKGQPGGSELLDRNLREIAQALTAAFGTINDLRTTIINLGDSITNISIAVGSTGTSGLAAFDAGGGSDDEGGGMMIPGPPGARGLDGRGFPGMSGDDGDDGNPGAPGRIGVDGAAGTQGTPGAPGFGNDGEDGEPGMALPGQPGAAGSTGSTGSQGVRGPQGDDGEDGNDSGARMDFSGLPLAALPSEYTTTGDVPNLLNGDSRIRSNYTRTAVGPYTINAPAILTVETDAALLVL